VFGLASGDRCGALTFTKRLNPIAGAGGTSCDLNPVKSKLQQGHYPAKCWSSQAAAGPVVRDGVGHVGGVGCGLLSASQLPDQGVGQCGIPGCGD